MMSGRRKLPPISISSPRDTGTDLPRPRRVQHQQQRGGIVVDDGRGFRAGQCAQHRFDRRVAFAATTLIEIVFERHRIDGCFDTGLRHRATDLRTAEVGVDDRAGHVENVSKTRPNAIVEALFDGLPIQLGCGRPRRRRRIAPDLVLQLANGLFNELDAIAIDQPRPARRGG